MPAAAATTTTKPTQPQRHTADNIRALLAQEQRVWTHTVQPALAWSIHKTAATMAKVDRAVMGDHNAWRYLTGATAMGLFCVAAARSRA